MLELPSYTRHGRSHSSHDIFEPRDDSFGSSFFRPRGRSAGNDTRPSWIRKTRESSTGRDLHPDWRPQSMCSLTGSDQLISISEPRDLQTVIDQPAVFKRRATKNQTKSESSSSPSWIPRPRAASSVRCSWPPAMVRERNVTEYLARSLLQLSVPILQSPAPQLVPLLVEHPPAELQHPTPPNRVTINVSLLNAGSSSSYSVSAKSAPTTPQGDWSPGAGAPPSPVNSPPKSPSHSAAKHDKADKHGVKQLSTSAPGMTQAPRPQSAGEPAASTTTTAATTPVTPAPEEPGSSKSRQKKFHRHFKQVAHDERVLNYYSCALVADILLQGQLYITKNYFAFYSNVFGYVTKLLIPTEKVVRISKEKTARIIPNAVGVATEDEKHVFGSLLSRDSTYRLMTQVWKAAMGPEPLIVLPVIKDVADEIETSSGRFINLHEDDESSLSGSERSVAPTPTPTDISHIESLCTRELSTRGLSALPTKDKALLRPHRSDMPRPTTLLLVSTALLVFLFLSAAFLLYRISLIQSQFIGNPLLSSSDQVYQEILKWQAQLHSRSANEVQEFLSSNLDQLAKVRKSLEALSLLLLRNEEYARTVRGRQQEYDTTFLRNGNS